MIVAGEAMRRQGFLAQFAVHGEALFQNVGPVVRQIFGGNFGETGLGQHRLVSRYGLQCLGGDPFPHFLGVGLLQMPVDDPVGEGKFVAGFENAIGLADRLQLVRQMQKGLLADDDVESVGGQGTVEHVALKHLDLLLQADKAGQFVRARRPVGGQFDAGHVDAVAGGPVAPGPARPAQKSVTFLPAPIPVRFASASLDSNTP